MKKENVKWHLLTPDAAVAKLQSNASCGLSRKEARSRCRSFGKNSFFDRTPRRQEPFWKPLVTDPALLLLVFSCLLSVCFSGVTVGFATLACLLFGLLFFVRLLWMERRLSDDVEAYRIPSACVLRDGIEYLIRATDVVPGDILLLKRGDVIPGDCRLLSSKDFAVLTVRPDEGGRLIRVVTQKKADAVYFLGKEPPLFELENRVFAGSEVLGGVAKALVTEVSDRTQLGSASPFAEAESTHRDGAERVRPYWKIYTVALFVLLLPLTVVALVTGAEEGKVLNVFLSLSALLATASSTLLTLYFKIPHIHLKNKHFYRKNAEKRAILKSDRAIEGLSTLTDVLVIGDCGITDGRAHLYRCATGRGEVDLQAASARAELDPLCEALTLFRLAKGNAPYLFGNAAFGEDFFSAWRELSEACEYDTEALRVRLLSVRHRRYRDTREELLQVEYRDSAHQLLFSENRDRLKQCTHFAVGKETVALNQEVRYALERFLADSCSEGAKAFLVIKTEGERLTLLGALALRPQAQRTLPSVLEELSQSGVRVSFFMSDEAQSLPFFCSSVDPSSRVLFASEASFANGDLTEFIGKYRVFAGFSQKQIALLIKELKEQGRRVAVMGADAEALPLMRVSSLSIACDAVAYHRQRGELLSEVRGQPEAKQICPSAVRRNADVLLHRADDTEGGLFTLLSLVADCRRLEYRYSILLRYLISSQLLRLIPIALSVCFGIRPLNSIQLLFHGLIYETVCIVWLLAVFVPQNRLRSPRAFAQKHVEAALSEKGRLLSAVAVSVVQVLLMWGLSLGGVLGEAHCEAYFLFSTVLLQLSALFLTVRSSALFPSWKSIAVLSGTVILPLLPKWLFTTVFPSLQSVFGAVAWNWISLSMLFLTPLLYLGFSLLFSRFFHRTAK